MITEQEITEEQAVWDIRDEYQRTLGGDKTTLTPEEALSLLQQANCSAVLRAIDATAATLRRKSQDASSFFPEELIQQLEVEIAKVLQRRVPVVIPASVLHIKASRRGTRGTMTLPEMKAEVNHRLAQTLTDEEVAELYLLSGNRCALVMQAARCCAQYTPNATHDYAVEKIHKFLQRELEKLPARN
jgi:hypothetical protein